MTLWFPLKGHFPSCSWIAHQPDSHSILLDRNSPPAEPGDGGRCCVRATSWHQAIISVTAPKGCYYWFKHKQLWSQHLKLYDSTISLTGSDSLLRCTQGCPSPPCAADTHQTNGAGILLPHVDRCLMDLLYTVLTFWPLIKTHTNICLHLSTNGPQSNWSIMHLVSVFGMMLF